MKQLLLSALVDFPTFIAGHGYDTGAAPLGEARGDDDEGGIPTAAIVAVIGLSLVTVAVLVLLDPSKARAKLKAVLPGVPIVVLIAAPLLVWAGSSEGDEESLIVERATGRSGVPEFILSLGEEKLNRLQTTRGRRAVRVECLGRNGQVVLTAEQKWPFILERGYDFPHAHQAVSRKQLQQADRCRLRGTRVRLEADVSGALETESDGPGTSRLEPELERSP